MGTGIDAARAAGGGVHADAMENMRDQLLVCLLKRLGPKVSIPISEVDATGDVVVLMSINQEARTFEFTVEKKQ